MISDYIMSEGKKVVEEYNALARALTEVEGATILLALYILGIFILVFFGKIEDMSVFKDLLTSGVLILTLIKVFDKKTA